MDWDVDVPSETGHERREPFRCFCSSALKAEWRPGVGRLADVPMAGCSGETSVTIVLLSATCQEFDLRQSIVKHRPWSVLLHISAIIRTAILSSKR